MKARQSLVDTNRLFTLSIFTRVVKCCAILKPNRRQGYQNKVVEEKLMLCSFVSWMAFSKHLRQQNGNCQWRIDDWDSHKNHVLSFCVTPYNELTVSAAVMNVMIYLFFPYKKFQKVSKTQWKLYIFPV